MQQTPSHLLTITNSSTIKQQTTTNTKQINTTLNKVQLTAISKAQLNKSQIKSKPTKSIQPINNN